MPTEMNHDDHRPLLASGLATPVVLRLAFASDTVSITIMEIVDAAAFPVNRWLIARGRGHAVVHRYHGPDHQ